MACEFVLMLRLPVSYGFLTIEIDSLRILYCYVGPIPTQMATERSENV